jgi:hypothetical protein
MLWVDYDNGKLMRNGPGHNFVDGNFVMHSIGAAVIQCLYPTGRLWSDHQHRFNDWEFFSRWERNGMRVDGLNAVLGQLHWHGDNVTANPERNTTKDYGAGKAPRGIEGWHAVRHLFSEQVTAISPR